MKIDQIKLYNFGSYEGENEFITEVDDDRNIILIGGKNGAGKTTLFTAIRLCLYGYMSMGYKNINSYYNRAVIKLINNNAKLSKPAVAFVQLKLSINNGLEWDKYILTRKWDLTDSVSESFIVKKNELELTTEQTADFEKYLLSLIPPELFNLYFFDGEKIADFFMNEGANTRIKSAFLTLCNYDTFEIMRKNFKRIGTDKSNITPELDKYLAAKDEYESKNKEYLDELTKSDECTSKIDVCDADIVSLDNEYSKGGGITQEEWNNKVLLIKEEEKKRDNWNALLRKWANDTIPLLMIKEQLELVKTQIEKENSNRKYSNFCEIIDTPEIASKLSGETASIKDLAFRLFGSSEEQILDFSFEQSANVLSRINSILEFDPENIKKCKSAIKKSIKKTSSIKAELEGSSVSNVQEYMKSRSSLLEEKSNLLSEQIEINQRITTLGEELKEAELNYRKAQEKLEDDLKKKSISDISARAIVMLDKLQGILYKNQIKKVESFFREEISTLMRKTHFIDDIMIDDDFNIHIYRKERIEVESLIKTFETNNAEQVESLLGLEAISKLYETFNVDSIALIKEKLSAAGKKTISLPIEIDKASLSNGEKQIFIMAMYHSLVQLCNHEIPFIIDTPFARIDTEHRQNISKYFFSKLKGQVFILSTNEEVDSQHVKIMKEKILATYLLENSDNKRTNISVNSYFEA